MKHGFDSRTGYAERKQPPRGGFFISSRTYASRGAGRLSHRDKGIEVYPAAAIADSGDSVRATTKQKGHSSQSGFCFVPNIFKLINSLSLRGSPKQKGHFSQSGFCFFQIFLNS